jgi:hypothetical protein
MNWVWRRSIERLYISFRLIFVLTVCLPKLTYCLSPSTIEITVMILKAITSVGINYRTPFFCQRKLQLSMLLFAFDETDKL